MIDATFELAPLFRAVEEALESNRQAFNQADPFNSNHGDHMVQVFQLAAQAAEEKHGLPLEVGIEYAACLLKEQAQNGSAQVYSRGLSCMVEQFRKYEITLEDLVSYVQEVLVEDRAKSVSEGNLPSYRESREGLKHSGTEAKDRSNQDAITGKSGKVLKALVSGLAAWGQEINGRNQTANPLDMGSLFEFGMAYFQARQRGGNKIEVLADAAVSVSPLSKVPHRCLSGKIAIQAFLQAMQVGAIGLSRK
jgi:hypothetical protein